MVAASRRTHRGHETARNLPGSVGSGSARQVRADSYRPVGLAQRVPRHAAFDRRRNTASGCAQVAPGRRLLVTRVSSDGWKTLTLCVAGVVRMYWARVLLRNAPTLSMLKMSRCAN